MVVKKRDSSKSTPVTEKVVSEKPVSPNVAIVTATKKSRVKAKQTKATRKTNPNKIKMARDSFTMPKDEYGQLKLLKSRLTDLNRPVKKSELLRAGIKQLSMMGDRELLVAISAVPIIKTGRPKKQN